MKQIPWVPLAVVALVALADCFFFLNADEPQPLGWTVGAYGFILTLFVVIRYPSLTRSKAGRILTFLLVVLSIGMVIEPTFIGFAWGLHGVVLLAVIGCAGQPIAPISAFLRWFEFWVTGWSWLPFDAWRFVRKRWSGKAGEEAANSGPVKFMKAWLAPAILACVFLALFAAANPVLELLSKRLQDFIRFLLDGFSFPSPQRVLFWGGCTVWLWALLRSRFVVLSFLKKLNLLADIEPLLVMARSLKTNLISPTEIVRSLKLFNAIFALQTIMDICYLWAGATLPQGMTYASYAHRGSYPLLAAALLAAAFILIAFRSGDSRPESASARKWVYVWLAQNLFLMFGAAWRLHLYVDVYSLTRFRVAAAIWMFVVALGLVWIIVRIVRGFDNAWLIRMNVFTVAAVLYLCALLNFDRMIAWHNVRHCTEAGGRGVEIDLDYLAHLDWEAIPALDWLAERAAGTKTALAAQRLSETLHSGLEKETSNWRGWTLRRANLAAK